MEYLQHAGHVVLLSTGDTTLPRANKNPCHIVERTGNKHINKLTNVCINGCLLNNKMRQCNREGEGGGGEGLHEREIRRRT